MSGIKTSVKFGRIEFAFYPDLLELAQSSDYPVIKAQTFTQETYHGHQLLHIRKVASDKIRKLRQLAVLLLVSVSYLLYLLGLLPFPLSGFVFKFKDAVLQVLVPAFQRFHLSTSEREPTLLARAVAVSVAALLSLSVRISAFTCFSSSCASAFFSCNSLVSVSRTSFFFSSSYNTAWWWCAVLPNPVPHAAIRISPSPLRNCRGRRPGSGG